jgi:hypothetical protein
VEEEKERYEKVKVQVNKQIELAKEDKENGPKCALNAGRDLGLQRLGFFWAVNHPAKAQLFQS